MMLYEVIRICNNIVNDVLILLSRLKLVSGYLNMKNVDFLIEVCIIGDPESLGHQGLQIESGHRIQILILDLSSD